MPRSRSASPRNRSRSPETRPSTSKSRPHDKNDTSSIDRPKKSERKEIAAISKLVQKKLENYINLEKREEKFAPDGLFRTTKRMFKYDMAYKLLEATALDKPDRSRDKSRSPSRGKDEGSSSMSAISPRLLPSTIYDGTTLRKEAQRLSVSANDIFQSLPVDRLAVIHGYRPDPKLARCVATGKVHNYTSHLGAALHADAYVNYYIKQGLGRKYQKSENYSDDEEGEHEKDKADTERKTKEDNNQKHSARREDQQLAMYKDTPNKNCPGKHVSNKNKRQKKDAHVNDKYSEEFNRKLSTAPTNRKSNSLPTAAVNSSSKEKSSSSKKRQEVKRKPEQERKSSKLGDSNTKKNANSKSANTEKPLSRSSSKVEENDGNGNQEESSSPKDDQEYSDDFESSSNATDSEDEFNGNSRSKIPRKAAMRPKTGRSRRKVPKSQRDNKETEVSTDTADAEHKEQGDVEKYDDPQEGATGDQPDFQNTKDGDTISIQTYASVEHAKLM